MKTLPHPMDVIRQVATPTVMVPALTPFMPIEEPGRRFLAAADGLWMELKTEWLYLRYPIATQTSIRLPYGVLTPDIAFAYDSPPVDLLQRFQHDARAASPAPAYAWITWSGLAGFRYLRLDRAAAAEGQCLCVPELMDGESIVFNLSSRGSAPAALHTNDIAECSSVYFIGVYGQCHEAVQDCRYCLLASSLKLEMNDVFSMLAQ